MNPSKNVEARRSSEMAKTTTLAVSLVVFAGLVATMPVGASHLGGTPGGIPLTSLDIDAGMGYVCVLNSGFVDCFDRNSERNRYLGGDAVDVSAGNGITCILRSSGNVKCLGQTSNYHTDDYTGGDAIAMGVGNNHRCILFESGNAECYGDNTYDKAASYNGGDAVDIAVGSDATCFLLKTGNASCTGHYTAPNFSGGDVTKVAASEGSNIICALRSNGNVDCNQSLSYAGGDAVDVDVSREYACILLINGNVDCIGTYSTGYLDYNGGDAIRLSNSGDITCILKSNGEVFCQESTSFVRKTYPWQQQEIQAGPGQPVGVNAATVVVYDNGNDVCAAFQLIDVGSQELVCVARALLGSVDSNVPRGETKFIAIDSGRTVQYSIGVEYNYDHENLLKAANLAGGAASAWLPFAPGDESWFVENGDQTNLVITVSVHVDGEELVSHRISIPYLGQILSSVSKTGPIPYLI